MEVLVLVSKVVMVTVSDNVTEGVAVEVRVEEGLGERVGVALAV